MNMKKLPKAVTRTADEMRKAGTDEAALKIEAVSLAAPADQRRCKASIASERNRRALCEFLCIGRGHPGSAAQCRGRDSHYSSNGQEAVSALRRSLRTRSCPRTHRRTGRRCRSYDGFHCHDVDTRLFYSWRESLGAGGFVGHRIVVRPRHRKTLRRAFRDGRIFDGLPCYRSAAIVCWAPMNTAGAELIDSYFSSSVRSEF